MLQHNFDDDGPLAEVVPLPQAKRGKPTAGAAKGAAAVPEAPRSCSIENRKSQIENPSPPLALSTFLPKERGYTLVLSGVLDANLELGPEQSPVLVRGGLAVPEGVTLKIKAGTCIHLRANAAEALAKSDAQPPSLYPLPQPGGGLGEGAAPSNIPATQTNSAPSPSAALCVWGTLLAEGVTGNPVEIINQEKAPAALLLYGSVQNKLEGLRLKDVSVTQAGAVCFWINCEFMGAPYYALAAGAALFTHCSFRNCGGIFATYNRGPWSLLARRNLFDGNREGIVLGRDPGEARLVIEKNNFVGMRGAHIRVMPVPKAKATPDNGSNQGDLELLIGENWYGSALLEEAEARLVDRRTDPAVHARLNTRPPAERPYANTGAGVSASVLAGTLREQQAVQQKLLQARPAPAPRNGAQPEPAVMSKAVSKTHPVTPAMNR